MDKFCVFCGALPESKNREHVLPMWLIRMTGDPNRMVNLGRDWNSETLEMRQYAFDQFTFPACESCNSDFAQLEASVKPVIEAMLASAALGAGDLNLLMDWIDKVRTGLWLGSIYLNKNHHGLSPMFHIGGRVASKDRLLVIFRLEDDGLEGVGWGATESPIFQAIPSCFTLTINHLQFLSVSYDFLLARQMGFPYPSSRALRSGGGEYVDLAGGSGEVHLPLFELELISGSTQLWQPMIPWGHFRTEDSTAADWERHYDNDYVRSCCSDFDQGRGHIFTRTRAGLAAYPDEPTTRWVPYKAVPRNAAVRSTGLDAGRILRNLMSNGPSLNRLSEDERPAIESQIKGKLELHQMLMEHFDRHSSV